MIPGATTSPQDPNGGDIASGETKTGNIDPRGDTDIFAFYGLAGKGVVIEMAALEGSNLDPEVQLYDPNGLLETEDYDFAGRARIDDHQLAKTGIYTIVAAGYDGYGGETGTYGLSLVIIPPYDPCGLYPYYPCPTNSGTNAGCWANELNWEAVTGATGYDVYFGTDVNTPLDKIEDNIGTNVSTIPYEPNHGKIYYWHVVAHTPGGDIAGPWWWFESYILSADFICDGIVNFLDYSEMADYFRQDEPSVDIAPPFGIIDNNDIAKFAEDWLRVELCCQGCL